MPTGCRPSTGRVSAYFKRSWICGILLIISNCFLLLLWYLKKKLSTFYRQIGTKSIPGETQQLDSRLVEVDESIICTVRLIKKRDNKQPLFIFL